MEPFVTHRGRIAVLKWTDVNTDLIIPARYLKRIERTGYGPLLFADRRYAPGGAPPIDDPDAHGPLAADFPGEWCGRDPVGSVCFVIADLGFVKQGLANRVEAVQEPVAVSFGNIESIAA